MYGVEGSKPRGRPDDLETSYVKTVKHAVADCTGRMLWMEKLFTWV